MFDPRKGNLSASKASPEKAMLQSTESHSHTESQLILFPYISRKSSYKTRITHHLPSALPEGSTSDVTMPEYLNISIESKLTA